MNNQVFALLLLAIVAVAPMKSFAAPPPGHPSVDDAAKMLKIPQQQEFRYKGEVLEAIPSNSYTYIQVKILKKTLWLAAPKLALRKGQFIRFPAGTMMRNFYSRRLQRTFPMVMFISAVDVLPEQT